LVLTFELLSDSNHGYVEYEKGKRCGIKIKNNLFFNTIFFLNTIFYFQINHLFKALLALELSDSRILANENQEINCNNRLWADRQVCSLLIPIVIGWT
jgi:hypothetical protein